jgi:hypothetical protein
VPSGILLIRQCHLHVANSVVFRRKSFGSLRLSYVLFAAKWLFPAKSLEGLQFARSQGASGCFPNEIALLFKGKYKGK